MHHGVARGRVAPTMRAEPWRGMDSGNIDRQVQVRREALVSPSRGCAGGVATVLQRSAWKGRYHSEEVL